MATNDTLFYRCTCNKKYKTWSQFDKHLRVKHHKRRTNKDDHVQVSIPVLVKPKKRSVTEEVGPNVNAPLSPCCVCTDAEANTATVPCGHMAFCHDCISTYHRENPTKGCPICNREIILITRIFRNIDWSRPQYTNKYETFSMFITNWPRPVPAGRASKGKGPLRKALLFRPDNLSLLCQCPRGHTWANHSAWLLNGFQIIESAAGPVIIGVYDHHKERGELLSVYFTPS